MKLNLWKKAVVALNLVTFALTGVLVPAGQAFAAVCPTSAGATTGVAGCPVQQVGNTAMVVPQIRWDTVATMTETDSGATMALAQDGLTARGNRSAQMLNLKAAEVPQVMSKFPSNVPVVFGRYNPSTADFRIDLYKVHRNGKTTTLLHSQFSPEHGAMWAASRTYAPASDRENNGAPGPNPFARFDSGDANFHNIGMDGAEVALGHAMRALSAPIGLLAVSDIRLKQTKHTSGGFLRKKTTIHIDGYAKPLWFIATPDHMQVNGTSAAICAIAASDCPQHAIAPAMVRFDKWDGGSMPEWEDHLYHWEKSSSGWTIIAMAVFAFALSFAFSFALTSMLGPAVGGGAQAGGLISGLLGPGIEWAGIGGMGLWSNMAAGALIDGVAYAVGTSAMNGGASLESVQRGYMGTVEQGDMKVTAANNEHEAALRERTNQRMTLNAPESSLSATQRMFVGDCPPGTPLASCGGNSGVVPRVDTYTEHNTTQFIQDNGMPLRSMK